MFCKVGTVFSLIGVMYGWSLDDRPGLMRPIESERLISFSDGRREQRLLSRNAVMLRRDILHQDNMDSCMGATVPVYSEYRV